LILNFYGKTPLIVEFAFFLVLFLLIHSYLVYPLTIFIVGSIKKKRIFKDPNYLPDISIIISVYNEENVIENTLRQLFKTDYDHSKIQFVIGSDQSTDNTNNIIEKLKEEIPNIEFLIFNERRGKSNVLNDLVKYAKGEILIFSDANTIYSPDAISKLISSFADKNVGGVSGRLLLLGHEKALKSGNLESKYWEIENWIKGNEGKLGYLIGANGGIYSIRKDLFIPIPTDSPVMDDFFISLKILEQNKLFLYEKTAIASEEIASDIKIENKRRIRNNAIDLSSIKYIKELLKPRFGIISYALWSHKIVRWFTPLLLILLSVSNLYLAFYNTFFLYLLFAQITFYALACLGFISKKLGINLIFLTMCYYFVYMNIGLLLGIVRFLRKKQTAFWQSTVRI
jgi:cellulose synthase/poly-beta-1,6-N-acetylglucosamine synthase-like glycosyltransferase